MPQISLWQNERYDLDAEWFDSHILDQFVMGGVDLYVHMYLGASNSNISPTDPTLPSYPNTSALNIQDLLFQENRDRIYSANVYRLRGYYNVQDLDLDLTQFGLMISNGVLYITVHTKNMIDTLGRKLMSGDVFELPNLKDFFSLDDTVPVALKRYYVVQEGTRPANGFSPSWQSHLWRLKCTPLIDSQEYSQILDQIVTNRDGDPVLVNGNTITYGNITSSNTYYQNMNGAIVQEALNEVPKSGYNTDALYVPLFKNGDPKQGTLPIGSSPQQQFTGFLVGNGEAVNGYPVTPSTSFPDNPNTGDYCLRQDYLPARLYRWSGIAWQYVNNVDRSNANIGLGTTQRDRFVNDSNIFTNSNGNIEPVIQNLSELLRIDEGGNSNS
ncbi:Uncharacterised protein [uncultured archaeon]|nr:Uncharacterised protein [uncultured archaeon]